MDNQFFKKIILESGFSKVNIESLLSCVENLGQNSLKGLELKLSESFSIELENYITDLWVEFSEYCRAFTTYNISGQDRFWKRLDEMKLVLNDDDKVDFLWCVMDIKKILGNNSDYNKLKYLVEFEILCFEYLPEVEILDLLKNHLVELCKKIELTEGIQFIFDKNFFNTKYNRMKQYSDAISVNSEKIGDYTVSELVTKFINSTSVPVKNRDSFHVTDFVIKNLTVTEEGKNLITEILKFYLWVGKPVINEKAVTDFTEKRRIEKENFAKEQVYLAQQENDNFSLPIIPTPKKIEKEENLEVEGEKSKEESGMETPTLPNSSLEKNVVKTTPTVKPVNIEEIVQKRKSTPVSNQGPGLYMGSGDTQNLKSPSTTFDKSNGYGASKLQILNNTTIKPQAPDIDKKLKELEQKAKKKV